MPAIKNNRFTSNEEGKFVCMTCRDHYSLDDMNALSRKEAGISGMCQKCQDSVFGPDEGDAE